MKKIFLVISCLLSFQLQSKIEYIDIGPLEEQDNAQAICEWECTKKNKEWTGGWECRYSFELDQHRCYCECQDKVKKQSKAKLTKVQQPKKVTARYR